MQVTVMHPHNLGREPTDEQRTYFPPTITIMTNEALSESKVRKEQYEAHETSSSEPSIIQVGFQVDEDGLPPGYFRSRFFVGTMLAVGLGLFGGTAGFKFSATVLGTINAEIGPDPNYTWIALVYTLTSAVTLLIIGRVSDIFGRR